MKKPGYIMLDAGHGGKDPGAVAHGIQEKEVNLEITLYTGEILERHGVAVGYTRKTDVYVDLNDRCRLANTWGADYFVSIHENAGGGIGAENIHSIFYGRGEQLALKIAEEFKAIGQTLRRGDGAYSIKGKNGDYDCVIRETEASAVITEFCFLDTDDVYKIDTVGERKQVAQAIAKGVLCQLGIPYVDLTPVQNPQNAENPLEFVPPEGGNITKLPFGWVESIPKEHRVIVHVSRSTYLDLGEDYIDVYAKGKGSKRLI